MAASGASRPSVREGLYMVEDSGPFSQHRGVESDPRLVNRTLQKQGWALFPGEVPSDLLERLRPDLEAAYEICAAIRARNGVDANADGSAHHIVGLADSFLDFLARRFLHAEIAAFLGTDKYILNSFG